MNEPRSIQKSGTNMCPLDTEVAAAKLAFRGLLVA